MSRSKVNLLKAFQAASQALSQNQSALNQADTYNHDHGDNMVEIFRVITQAMEAKKNASPADQLAYASELLRSQQSGSAKIYSQGLAQAADQFHGKSIKQNNVLQLIQSLLGGQAAQSGATLAPADPLSSLLGGLMGGPSQPGSQTAQSEGSAASSDPLSALLGGLMGGSNQPETQGGQGGLDLGSLLSMGLSLLQSNQQGGSGLESLLNTLVSGSQMGNSDHRTQSGKIVANTLLNAILPMLGK